MALTLPVFLACGPARAASYFVYAASGSEGVYRAAFDTETGKGTAPELIVPQETGVNFINFHPTQNYLYGCTRKPGQSATPQGLALAYMIERNSGGLSLLDSAVIQGGPAHINIDATGRMAVLANYTGGSITALPVKADGTFGEVSEQIQLEGSSVNPQRQQEAHPHSGNFSPDNKWLLVPDLGQDKVFIYDISPEEAKLAAHDPAYFPLPPGSGPRHMCFGPSGQYAYVINELLSTVAVFAAGGGPEPFKLQQVISTLPDGFSETSTCAEVLPHPSGKYLYASNRGHDSIAVFEVDQETGKLTALEQVSTGGVQPRNFRLDPTGQFLFAANQKTNNVVIFRIDQGTGRLTPTGETWSMPNPMCVRFFERH